MNKRLSLVVALLLVLALAFTGCARRQAQEEFKFTRSVEIIVPWGAGGGADTTVRAFAPHLERALGVPVVVNNVSGGGGVMGFEHANRQPADGYTFMLGTQSHLLAHFQGLTSVNPMDAFIPVVRLVHDTNILVASARAPFRNFDELLAHIRANPGVVKAGVLTVTGLDAFMIRQTFLEAGVEVPLVPFSTGAELNAAVLGGHVHLAVVGPAEVKGLLAAGDMQAIVVAAERRIAILPDVTATGERNIDSYLGPMRAIFAKKGTPEAAIKAFEAAAVKAHATAEFQAWMKANALDQRPAFANTADLKKIWEEQNTTLKELFDRFK
ncbi:MAG: tripartite tricarboxylate transporter substrate binding protein [Selenomonadales bacterium]|nr:tripartite tricarboxylate transporter substrate binding protein [Selenomonadales bacterium]